MESKMTRKWRIFGGEKTWEVRHIIHIIKKRSLSAYDSFINSFLEVDNNINNLNE